MPKAMKVFEIFDIVAVPFPYLERPIAQRRPALIIAPPRKFGGAGVAWVFMITSAANRRWPGDIDVDDLERAGLPVPSLIRPAKIATVESHILETRGVLAKHQHDDVRRAIHTYLG